MTTHILSSPSTVWLERALGALSRRIRRVVRPASFGTLRRLEPLSETTGYDRGLPIDRRYIDTFLRAHSADIRGQVLEVRDDRYTRTLGTAVSSTEILDVDASNPRATICADLCAMPHVPSATFDCAIVTQTLQYVGDPRAAFAEIARVLRPGGVLLATVPAAPPIDRNAAHVDRWRFTDVWLEELLSESFGEGEVVAMGNVLTLVASVMGIACEELSPAELCHHDPRFPVVLGLRAARRA